MHPDYPWLYVGKTDASLEKRIKQHASSSSDNISRDYLPLLEESTVYYVELENSLQTTYVEKLLIDKYKPHLNKADKIKESTCPIDVGQIKWKKYEVKPKEIIVERPIKMIETEPVTIEVPVYQEVYRDLTKKQKKEFEKSEYRFYENMRLKDEIASIQESGVIATRYNRDIHGRLFQPNAQDLLNYCKAKKNKDEGLFLFGTGKDCFGRSLRFEFDDGRASISRLENEDYGVVQMSAWVGTDGFKEIIHIANTFGGIYGVSKRDYILLLEYFEDQLSRSASPKKCEDKIKSLKESISIIENADFYIPDWAKKLEFDDDREICFNQNAS